MRTIEQHIYKIDELSPTARKRALQFISDREAQDYDPQFTIDGWVECLSTEFGFDDADIRYSGFGSQGDGASFTATVNLIHFVEKDSCVYPIIDEISVSIVRHPCLYVHERTCFPEFNYTIETTEEQRNELCKLHRIIHDLREKLCIEIYADLQAEFDDLTDEQNCLEVIACNEYEFYADGSIAARYGEVQ